MSIVYTKISTSARTLDWEALPALGEDRDRRAFRARVWRWMLVGLASFWAGFFAVLVAAFG